jgi:hypothetical protein
VDSAMPALYMLGCLSNQTRGVALLSVLEADIE